MPSPALRFFFCLPPLAVWRCSRFTELPNKVKQHIKPKGARWVSVRLAGIPHRWRVNTSIGNAAEEAPVTLIASAALLQSDPSNQVRKRSSPNTHLTWAAWYTQASDGVLSARSKQSAKDGPFRFILSPYIKSRSAKVRSLACRVVGARNCPDFYQDHPDNEPSTASCTDQCNTLLFAEIDQEFFRDSTPYRVCQDPGSSELMLAIMSLRADHITGSCCVTDMRPDRCQLGVQLATRSNWVQHGFIRNNAG
ncbi:hypothetical protein B0H17DRAFT_1143628 [Mycena rosella]|uniref:Uncharacterized protein n=1 Tax=Mycena rosella TaxID=1033263 RepID=A0AAD7CUN9_MYCRO|nr:hypothetical protein B0H17DRAFT_1143628 [Mycena rosella]